MIVWCCVTTRRCDEGGGKVVDFSSTHETLFGRSLHIICALNVYKIKAHKATSIALFCQRLQRKINNTETAIG